MKKRLERLNSLLKQVISEVITRDVKNPKISKLLTVIKVDISKDLHQAKVYVSVIGDEEEKKNTLKALKESAGFISSIASKKVTMRFFPSLTFLLDTSLDKFLKIEEILEEIKKNG